MSLLAAGGSRCVTHEGPFHPKPFSDSPPRAHSDTAGLPKGRWVTDRPLTPAHLPQTQPSRARRLRSTRERRKLRAWLQRLLPPPPSVTPAGLGSDRESRRLRGGEERRRAATGAGSSATPLTHSSHAPTGRGSSGTLPRVAPAAPPPPPNPLLPVTARRALPGGTGTTAATVPVPLSSPRRGVPVPVPVPVPSPSHHHGGDRLSRYVRHGPAAAAAARTKAPRPVPPLRRRQPIGYRLAPRRRGAGAGNQILFPGGLRAKMPDRSFRRGGVRLRRGGRLGPAASVSRFTFLPLPPASPRGRLAGGDGCPLAGCEA